MSKELIDKIALFCDVDAEGVIPLQTAESIYQVPALLEEANLGDFIVEKLKLDVKKGSQLGTWGKTVDRMIRTDKTARVAIVGKYTELRDAYMSVIESLTHAGAALDHKVNSLNNFLYSFLYDLNNWISFHLGNGLHA